VKTTPRPDRKEVTPARQLSLPGGPGGGGSGLLHEDELEEEDLS
jgi:hypothetical protein